MFTLHRLCNVLCIVDESGQRQRCEGVGPAQLRVRNGDSVVVDVYVVGFKPLGLEFIMGINGISAPGNMRNRTAPRLQSRLKPCDDDNFGPAKGLIPLTAIVQQN